MSSIILFSVLVLVHSGHGGRLEILENGEIVIDEKTLTKFSGLLIMHDGAVVMKGGPSLFCDGFESGDMSRWSFWR